MNYFKSKIKLNIKGKNIHKFIKRLISNKIEMLKINYIKHNEANIIVYKKDYDNILKIKSIYEVNEIETYGLIKIKKIVNLYKYIIIGLIISLIIIIILSKMIFKIEVIHDNSNIRKFMLDELETNGISKYKFKKNYDDIQIIKKNIMDKYKDKLEWLEIEEVGTKYVIRLKERIIVDNTKDNKKYNVIAKKGGIIKKIIASNGNIIREINNYVNKGDIIISGNVYLNEDLKDVVGAKGSVLAEVWYNVTVTYPYIYSEIKTTGNSAKVYALKILNNVIEINKKFKEKNIEEKVILNHNLLPISLVLQKQFETTTISQVLTNEEATSKAISEAILKMNNKLLSNEEIIEYKVLKTSVNDDSIVLNMFFSVLEDITEYQEIVMLQ